MRGHFGPINAISFRPDGRAYATGGEDGYVRLHHFDVCFPGLSSIAPARVSPDGLCSADSTSESIIKFSRAHVSWLQNDYLTNRFF